RSRWATCRTSCSPAACGFARSAGSSTRCRPTSRPTPTSPPSRTPWSPPSPRSAPPERPGQPGSERDGGLAGGDGALVEADVEAVEQVADVVVARVGRGQQLVAEEDAAGAGVEAQRLQLVGHLVAARREA